MVSKPMAEAPGTSQPSRDRSAPVGPSVGLIAALVLVVVVVLAGGTDIYRLLGYTDPGTFTKLGTYLLRFLFDVSAALCAGSLVYAAFFTDSSPSAGLSPQGWAAVRLGGWYGWMWFGTTLLLVPFDAAESIGVSASGLLSPARLADAVIVLYEPAWWLTSAMLALLVALCCRAVLRWRPTVALAAVAVAGLMPPVFSGHTAAGADHDLTMIAMMFHVVAAGLWLGVLASLWLDMRRGIGEAGTAVRRYPAFALGCWLVLALSGLVSAVLLVPPARLFSTSYGLVVVAKVAGLVAVGAVGVVVRRRVVCRLRRDEAGRGLLRIAGAEGALLLVTIGVTMGVAQAPPPASFERELSPVEVGLGYALPEAPTLLRLLTTWRLDLLLGVACLVAAALYLAAVRRLHRRGERWPVGRTVSWLAGTLVVLLATSSGVGAYAPATVSTHMTSHMALNMLAPLLLVLAGPVTLALRALEPAEPGTAPGPREWLAALTDSPLARWLAHPGLAAVLFVASYYVLYFTGVFEAAISEHWSRMVLNVVVLAIGYQFYWLVIGIDAAPRRLPYLGRLVLVFAVMPFHAVFAVILMSITTVIGDNYYRTLDLPWPVDLLADQLLAGVVSLVAGEIALVIAQVVLLVQWHRDDQMAAFRRDPLDQDDEEAAAYRSMLAALRETRGRR